MGDRIWRIAHQPAGSLFCTTSTGPAWRGSFASAALRSGRHVGAPLGTPWRGRTWTQPPSTPHRTHTDATAHDGWRAWWAHRAGASAGARVCKSAGAQAGIPLPGSRRIWVTGPWLHTDDRPSTWRLAWPSLCGGTGSPARVWQDSRCPPAPGQDTGRTGDRGSRNRARPGWCRSRRITQRLQQYR